MSEAPDIDRLRDVGLFGGLSDASLDTLAHAHEILDVLPGTLVFRQDDPGREMFVVLDGEIELFRDVSGQEAHVAKVTTNDWFGEMSILDIQPRPTTARVVTASQLLRLTAHDLDVLYRRDLKGYTLFVLNIAREMSRRLRLADELLTALRVERQSH